MRYYYFYFLFIFTTILPLQVCAFSIEPSGYRAIVEPNSAEQFVFTVNNSTDRVRSFSIRLADDTDELNTSTIEPWVTMPDSISLAPNTSEKISITVTTPLTALPGDNYTYVLFQEQSELRNVSISPVVGVPLTITVAGEIQEQVNIQYLDIVTNKKEVYAQVQLDNSGMVEVPVNGVLRIAINGDQVLSQKDIQTTIRSGQQVEETVYGTVPTWYMGYISTSFVGTYGVFSDTLSIDEKKWYIAPMFQWTLFGIVVLLIGLLLYFYIKKRHTYVKNI